MLGRMNIIADILRESTALDSDGFNSVSETTVASGVRIMREARHGSLRWSNRAAWSEATDLFVMRWRSDVAIGDILKIGDDRWRISSIDDTSGHGLYLEILAARAVPVAAASGAPGPI